VALKVTQGDLSARIRFPELEKESPLQYVIIDELSMMISTVNGMIERIERQESDRRVFISSIAHDLRTPLTSINGFLSAMLDGTIPPEKCEYYMQIVKTEVDRIQKLTDTMSEASALGQVNNIRMEPFDINDLIKETLTNLEKQLGNKNLGVQLELFEDEKGDLVAFGDRQSILRVVYNILTNAIKFTPEDGTIAITTYYEGRDDQILVSIEDSGLGIPPEQRGRIFDSFYKIDKSRTDTASGSGLGLYICKEILRAHDQTIQVDTSKDLGGSIFTFTLSGIRKLDE
jgi:signal transduction histidine kinase